MATPQENLDLAFPLAVEGDAVLDQATGEYWYKNADGIWINIGEILGEFAESEYDIAPFAETIVLEYSAKTGINLLSLSYSLTPVLTTVETSTLSVAAINKLINVEIPLAEISLEAPVPARGTGDAYISPLNKIFAVVTFEPGIDASLSVQNSITIGVAAYLPGTQAQIVVNVTKGLVLIPKTPSVSTVPTFEPINIQILTYEPSKIGSFLLVEAPELIQLLSYAPSITTSVKTAFVFINKYTPVIQTPVIIPESKVFEIRANLPDDGSGIIVPATVVNCGVFIVPSIDAYEKINEWEKYIGWSSSFEYDVNELQSFGYTSLNRQEHPVVNRFYPVRWKEVTLTGSGIIATDQKKFNNASAYFVQGTTNDVSILFINPFINTQDFPYLADQITNLVSLGRCDAQWMIPGQADQDFIFDFWIRPLPASFTGTTESDARPIMINSGEPTDNSGAFPSFERGFDVHFRGSGSNATVYVRINDGTTGNNAVNYELSSTNNLIANTWNHVLWMRQNGVMGVAVNGVWGSTVNYNGSFRIPAIDNSGGDFAAVDIVFLRFGRFRKNNQSGDFVGDSNMADFYLDDIRFAYGTTDSYSFSNFSVPTTPKAGTIKKRTELLNPYLTVTSYYEKDTWQWFRDVEVVHDAQLLEPGVKFAINKFLIGCKKDQIWPSMVDCYIFIGPRSLNGVLSINLHGSNPNEWHSTYAIGNGFVTGDYNRETGLRGDGITKWIRTPRVAKTFDKANHHRAAWVSEPGTGPIFSSGISQAGSTYVDWIPGLGGIRHGFVTNNLSTTGEDALTSLGGFVGFNRSDNDKYYYITPGESGFIYEQAQTPWLEPVEILGASVDQANNYQVVSRGTHRLAFYSQGSALDLNKLKYRVSLLVSDIQSAII